MFAGLAAILVGITPDKDRNPFNGPMLVADRILEGRADLPPNIGWMESFHHEDRKYLAYPPMASLVMVPYALAGGSTLGQTAFNSGLIFATAFLLFLIFSGIPDLRPLRLLAPTLYVVGTPVLYSAGLGDVWLLMHSEGNFFLALAILLSVVRRNFFLAGVAYMIAGQVRYAILFAAPAFLLLALLQAHGRNRALRDVLAFGLGCLPPALLIAGYNLVLFGDPFFLSYTATWAEWGQKPLEFSVAHAWRNFVFYTSSLPVFSPEAPYLRFPSGGQTLLVMSPFLWGALLARWRLPVVRAAGLGVTLMFSFYLCYSYQGSTQFGSRYMIDLFPLLFPLALSAFTRPGRAWYPLLALLAGVAIALNAYGTLTSLP